MLSVLVQNGEAVSTFDEIAEALWGEARPLEVAQGIRENMTTLRQVFCDSARQPRFFENVPRVGYRFIGTASTESDDAEQAASETKASSATAPEANEPGAIDGTVNQAQNSSNRRTGLYVAALLALPLTIGAMVLSVRGCAVSKEPNFKYSIHRVTAGLTREGKDVRRVTFVSEPGPSVLSPDGLHLFTTHPQVGSLSVVDLMQAKIIRQITIGGQPLSISITPDGRTLLIGNYTEGIDVVDIESGRVRHIRTGGPVYDNALAPDGTRLYLAMAYQGLKRLDIASGSVQSIAGIVCPVNLALQAPTNRLWISCRCGGSGGRLGHDNIDVLDLASERPVRTFGGPPIVGGDIAASPDGSQVWIDGSDACSSSRYDHEGCPAVPSGVLHAFRSNDARLLRSFPVATPGALQFTPDSGKALFGINTQLYVFDTAAVRLVESVRTNASYTYFSPIRPEIYTVSSKPNELQIIRLPPDACEPAIRNRSFHLTSDGVDTNLFGAGRAILQGGADYGPGILGQAFRFNGRTAYIELDKDGGQYGIRVHSGHTSTFWIKPERTGLNEVITERVAANGNVHWRILRRSDDRIAFEIYPGERVSSQMVSSDAAKPRLWTSIGLLSTADGVALYLNGQYQSQVQGSYSPDIPGARTRYGAGFEKHHFAGLLDEIIVRDEVLSANELKEYDESLRRCHSAVW